MATADDIKRLREETSCDVIDCKKALEEAKVIRIEKTFDKSRPKTTVFLSKTGRESFMTYLKALEEVLQKAALALTHTAGPDSCG